MNAEPNPPADAAHEQAVRDFWAAREPGYDEIAVSVRRGGRVVRFVLLTPKDASTWSPISSSSGPAA